ncbi:MAG: PfkB family carbohydrate kinase [Ilumatobacteraceae bacterium]
MTWHDGCVVVVVGEALVDLVIGLDGSVIAALGGAPFNTARTCGRLGTEVAFVGAVSEDRFGTLIAAELDRSGVSTELVQRVTVPTTLAAAELDEHGAATYRFYSAATSAPALRPVELPAATATLFTGGLGLVLEPMADAVGALVEGVGDEVVVVVDLNCRPAVIADRDAYVARVERVLRRADVVKVSDDDLRYLSPGEPVIDAACELLGKGPGVVLLTAGASHVTVLTQGDERRIAVEPVEVADTIGAGDAFGGGFVSWWAAAGRGRVELGDVGLLTDAVVAANRVAGVVCTRHGADPPWRADLPAGWSGDRVVRIDDIDEGAG